jgi:AraC-like DNA-binding protein
MTTLLDTRGVDPTDRLEYWAAGIAEHFFPVGLDPNGPLAFDAQLTGGRVGAVAVCSITGASHTVRRTARMVARGDPDSILVYLLRNGSCRIEQDDRSCVLGPGDLAMHDTSRPSTFEAYDGLDLAIFSFPKWLLGAQGNDIIRHTATRVGHSTGCVARLGAPFLAEVACTVEHSAITGQEAEGLCEMLVATLRALHGGSERGPTPTMRGDALLAQMRRYALDHLHDPGLGPEQIARAHFYSARYVHKLFAEDGSGVSAWIRKQRMERALADLRRPSDDTVAAIALRWGYRDAASFSRAFRQTYGCSPSDLRRGR